MLINVPTLLSVNEFSVGVTQAVFGTNVPVVSPVKGCVCVCVCLCVSARSRVCVRVHGATGCRCEPAGDAAPPHLRGALWHRHSRFSREQHAGKR